MHRYFEHVQSAPGYEPRVALADDTVWDDENPWARHRETIVSPDAPADVLFLGGHDWRFVHPRHRDLPVVNIVQHVRHARPEDPRYAYLARRAVRICISSGIEEELARTGRVNGPVITIPLALELDVLPAPRPDDERDVDVLVLSLKERALGVEVVSRLGPLGNVRVVDRQIPRRELLDLFARARVALLLPRLLEGSYTPPLEAFALGAVTVCPDFTGDRTYCRDGETCLVPARDPEALAAAARAALAGWDDLAPMRVAARAEVEARSPAVERRRFHDVLARLDELWG